MHKPVKGVLRLEIEKLQAGPVDFENISESGSVTNDSVDTGDRTADGPFTKCPSNGSDGSRTGDSKWNSFDGKEIHRNGLNAQSNPDISADDVSFAHFS